MDDFGQIIGFIIAAIFFIASAIRKKNKKGAPVKQGNSFTNVLESFLGEDVSPQEEIQYAQNYVHPDIEEKPVVPTPEKPISFKKSESSISRDRLHSSFDSRKKEGIKRKKTRIDLRQAVIYSEILNRKEF